MNGDDTAHSHQIVAFYHTTYYCESPYIRRCSTIEPKSNNARTTILWVFYKRVLYKRKIFNQQNVRGARSRYHHWWSRSNDVELKDIECSRSATHIKVRWCLLPSSMIVIMYRDKATCLVLLGFHMLGNEATKNQFNWSMSSSDTVISTFILDWSYE